MQVRLAKQWKSVPEQKKCSVQWDHHGTLSIQGKSSQTSIIHVKGCDDVDFLEHVQAHVTLAASKRGDVEISLTSPKGTKSLLIAKRPKDYSRAGFTDWPFLTVRSIHVYLGTTLSLLEKSAIYICAGFNNHTYAYILFERFFHF